MCPVNDCHLSILSNNNVTWIEISVTYFIMFWHALQTCQKLIPCCRIQIFQTINLSCQFVFQFIQSRCSLAMHLQLKIYKVFHILLYIGWICLHHLSKCLSVFVFNNNRPFSINLCYTFHLRNVKTGFFYSCRIQRFVKHICF